ncbi:STAS domain-containing protein [Embleya sp. NBC_00896]|uniref:STAS domain-containing protein n=1 Tax=Embleya sp. NBC_00896 TaxID=2975961 RepID=UPI00386CD708|nr:STAS domain-containing protein [Embleya sp. NBC_00896]
MTDPGIDSRVRVHGHWNVVELVGELDCATVFDAEAVLLRLPMHAGAAVVVDLSEVTFLDCAALHMLSRTRSRVLALGGTFHLICPGTWPRRIMQVVGLLYVFRPVASQAELGIDVEGSGVIRS